MSKPQVRRIQAVYEGNYPGYQYPKNRKARKRAYMELKRQLGRKPRWLNSRSETYPCAGWGRRD